jgi:hypothetical protein
MPKPLRPLWRVVRALLLALAAAVLLIEEWGWRPLTAWAARITRWPPLARLEDRLRRLSPRRALALFMVPALLLFPIKLMALWFIHRGHIALGIAVIVAAKLLGTAFVGRLFIVLEPQLLQFARFARALAWWRATRRRIKSALRAWLPWRTLKVGMRRWRTRWRHFSR